MCQHHHDSAPKPDRKRFGSRLEHGSAHEKDHASWSRRDFLVRSSMMAAGTAVMVNGMPVRAVGRPSLLQALSQIETDRVLVLVQLSGGNDGLNTVIPIENDIYYNNRPNLAIDKNDALALGNDHGFHPRMGDMHTMWNDGKLGIIQNVGYPDPNRSHFRSTDIWNTGSDAETLETTGWLGRSLDAEFPDFIENPPTSPLAVQIGGSSSLIFQGPSARMGMTMRSPEIYYDLAEGGAVYDLNDVPDTTYGQEMAFVRSVANNSFAYADAIQDASETPMNDVSYPSNNLAESLSIVAQLIKGGLGARIYLVSINGFDTHANQIGTHDTLLSNVSSSVKSFHEDISTNFDPSKVLIMSYSEFGRDLHENGSGGTDHGTAAPMFLFGDAITPGFYGTEPDLTDLDNRGDLIFSTDFRAVYGTVLKDWFGLSEADIANVLGDGFEWLNFVSSPTSVDPGTKPELPTSFSLAQNYPNPFNPATVITYTLSQTSPVRLQVFDITGRLVETLVNENQFAGEYTIPFHAGRLPSGTYIYQLETALGKQTKKMILLR